MYNVRYFLLASSMYLNHNVRDSDEDPWKRQSRCMDIGKQDNPIVLRECRLAERFVTGDGQAFREPGLSVNSGVTDDHGCGSDRLC